MNRILSFFCARASKVFKNINVILAAVTVAVTRKCYSRIVNNKTEQERAVKNKSSTEQKAVKIPAGMIEKERKKV